MKKDPSSAVQAETRRLAAIMFTDIVGFSRQMGADENRTLRLLDVHNHIIQQAVTEHHGTIIKTVGDAFLIDFPSVVHAVQCAQQIQAQFRTQNAEKEPVEQIHVRIGIHLGDIVQRDDDVFGDGVNIASRLQGLAEPDTICISQAVYKEIEKKLPLGTVVSLGRPKLKNIAQRERVYALLPEPPKGFHQRLQVQRLKLIQWRRTLQAAALLVLVLGAGGLGRYLYSPSAPALPLPDKPSLVVLPFVNMSGDPQQEYFSDGLTEDLTSDLSKISSLFVISRNSAFTYKGKVLKLPKVSRELGVQYVLEGSVRKADGQVRVTAQLVDATQDQHLWSERYDRPLKDIFALQDEIRQKIVMALRVKLTKEEQARFQRYPTNNLEAYDAFLRGYEYFSHLTKDANVQARQMLEKAIALDPQYAAAYAMLAWSYLAECIFQWKMDPQTLERAFETAQRAVALDESLALPHLTLGYMYLWKKQPRQAVAEGYRARVLDPNNPDIAVGLADIVTADRRQGEALGLVEEAMRLNPQYPDWYLLVLGQAYDWVGQKEEKIAVYKKVLARTPDSFPAHLSLALVYSWLGREAEARAEIAGVVRIKPSFSLEDLKMIPTMDDELAEDLFDLLRKAGLK